ncbi:MAG: phosphatase PAP2 family protein [Acidobacteria bacterium]|nr:phosphatase PAP2 family protein [Acidobacteriota bacterium]
MPRRPQRPASVARLANGKVSLLLLAELVMHSEWTGIIAAAQPKAVTAQLHPHERVILSFLAILAILGLVRRVPMERHFFLCLLPATLWGVWHIESRISKRWTRILREWASLALLLVAYWALEVFATQSKEGPRSTWLFWDHHLLYSVGLKNWIETGGRALPTLLETVYLLLYSLPPICLGAIYLSGASRRSGKFLFVLFLGTLAAYALIPMFPAASPRTAFPGVDLPAYLTFPRSINLWLLDHMDITTSVFPSGHVAVAFSCAFGLLRTVPARPRACGLLGSASPSWCTPRPCMDAIIMPWTALPASFSPLLRG